MKETVDTNISFIYALLGVYLISLFRGEYIVAILTLSISFMFIVIRFIAVSHENQTISIGNENAGELG